MKRMTPSLKRLINGGPLHIPVVNDGDIPTDDDNKVANEEVFDKVEVEESSEEIDEVISIRKAFERTKKVIRFLSPMDPKSHMDFTI